MEIRLSSMTLSETERIHYLATAITMAPHAFPICTAARPTPPAAPKTSNTYSSITYILPHHWTHYATTTTAAKKYR